MSIIVETNRMGGNIEFASKNGNLTKLFSIHFEAKAVQGRPLSIKLGALSAVRCARNLLA